MEKFKNFKHFAKSQGFRNQREFKKHVDALRVEREKRIIPPINDLKIRYFAEHSNEFKILIKSLAIAEYFVDESNKGSKRSSAIYSFNAKKNSIRYANSYSLEYFDYGICFIKNYIRIEKIFRNKKTVLKIALPDWLNPNNKNIIFSACLYKSIAIKKRENICVLKNIQNQITGWAVKNVNGSWSHAKTLKLAIEESKRQNEIFKQKTETNRKKHLVSLLCKNWHVTREDSFFAGNCKMGTDNFIFKNGLAQRKFLRSHELKKYMDFEPRVKLVYDYAVNLIAQSK